LIDFTFPEVKQGLPPLNTNAFDCTNKIFDPYLLYELCNFYGVTIMIKDRLYFLSSTLRLTTRCLNYHSWFLLFSTC